MVNWLYIGPQAAPPLSYPMIFTIVETNQKYIFLIVLLIVAIQTRNTLEPLKDQQGSNIHTPSLGLEQHQHHSIKSNDLLNNLVLQCPDC
jgi:hypothetical protein